MYQLLATIKNLSSTGIRSISYDEIKLWLGQFRTEEEKLLGILIIRYMIYRNEEQMLSLIKSALRKLAFNYIEEDDEPFIKWLQILNRKDKGLKFTFGPPIDREFGLPGKSGELMIRFIKQLGISKSSFDYPECANILNDNDIYVLVDDAILTSDQITGILHKFHALKTLKNCAIVVGIIHKDGLDLLNRNFPNIKIFYGEVITHEHSLTEISKYWIDKRIWNYEKNPIDVYTDLCNDCKFEKRYYFGHNSQALLLMYHHSVPDNSLQLLWDASEKWNPLKKR